MVFKTWSLQLLSGLARVESTKAPRECAEDSSFSDLLEDEQGTAEDDETSVTALIADLNMVFRTNDKLCPEVNEALGRSVNEALR